MGNNSDGLAKALLVLVTIITWPFQVIGEIFKVESFSFVVVSSVIGLVIAVVGGVGSAYAYPPLMYVMLLAIYLLGMPSAIRILISKTEGGMDPIFSFMIGSLFVGMGIPQLYLLIVSFY